MTTPAPSPAGAIATNVQTPASTSASTNGTNGANGKSQLPAGRDEKGRFAPSQGEASGQGAPPPKAKLRIKDLEMDEDAAWNEIQRARHATRLLTEAQKRAAEAAERQSRYDGWKGKLKAGDSSALDEILADLSPEQRKTLLTQHVYSRFVEPEQMSPEQRALAEERQRREALERQISERDETARKEELSRASKEEASRLQAEILEAAELGRIPKSPAAVRRIASIMQQFEERDLSIPLAEAARRARDAIGEETGEFAEAADIAELKELWGDARFAKVSRKWLDYFRAKANAKPEPPARPPNQTASNGQRKKMTPQEFLQRFSRKG